MEPDDSSFTPSSSNRGHGGQQRQFPFQGEYEHTANTPKRRRLDESQSPAQCQPYYNDMPTPQASLPMPSKSQTPRFTPFSLLPVNEQGPQNISELDALICQNVELFQSYAEEGPQSAQLGLRCVHCARAMQRHVTVALFSHQVLKRWKIVFALLKKGTSQAAKHYLSTPVRLSIDYTARKTRALKVTSHCPNFCKLSAGSLT